MEDQANWLSSNNTSGKNLRMKKLNLICLIFCYQTTYHKVGVVLQHSFAELWGRFEEFLAIFFYFFPKIFWKILVSRFESYVRYVILLHRKFMKTRRVLQFLKILEIEWSPVSGCQAFGQSQIYCAAVSRRTVSRRTDVATKICCAEIPSLIPTKPLLLSWLLTALISEKASLDTGL